MAMNTPTGRRTARSAHVLAVCAAAGALLASLATGQVSPRSSRAPRATLPAASVTRPASQPAGSQPATTRSSQPASGRAEEAKIAAAKTQIANLQVVVNMFEVDCGRYPTTAEGLAALVKQPANCPNWGGPYLKEVTKDPWGNPYVYACPGKHNTQSFDICSFGPDGKEGGGDDIDNWSQK